MGNLSPRKTENGRYEYPHECVICEDEGFWPEVFAVSKYWVHTHCIEEAIEREVGRRDDA